MRVLLVLVGALLAPVPVGAAALPPTKAQVQEPALEKLAPAIKRGLDYLKAQQKEGHWEHLASGLSLQYPGGTSCLVVLALVEAGVPAEDPALQKGLAYIRAMPPTKTYLVALQTAVLAKVGQAADKPLLQRNVDWLLAKAHRKNGKIDGWSYPQSLANSPADHSNTHYAVMGLHAAAQAGITIDKEVWQQIGGYYLREQLPSHGWSYSEQSTGRGKSYHRLCRHLRLADCPRACPQL
jgi:hypothetical protein